MRRVIAVVAVEHKGCRGRWVAGNTVIPQRLRQAIQILAVDAVFQV
jgi:hypothetical protein